MPHFETYRFHEGANRIYDFFWGEFCDWYLELDEAAAGSSPGGIQRSKAL